MRTITVIAVRAGGRLAGQMTSVFAIVVFLSVAGALFANGLFSAEGTAVSPSSVWALAVANVLPLLTSLLTMRLWSEDGLPDRAEIDLVAPVPERAFAAGRFLAAFVAIAVSITLSLAVPIFLLPRCAPALEPELTIVRFMPAWTALLIFAVPLTAIGSLTGVCLRRAASSAVASAALTYAIPYAVYRALLAWSPAARMKFAESPVLTPIADAADGFVSVGMVVVAFAFAAFAIYATSKMFALRRFVGGGQFALKVSSLLAIGSALLAASLLSILALHVDTKMEWPGASRTAAFSARTREILSGAARKVRVTACLRRDSTAFLPTVRLLRALASESRAVVGAEVVCDFVDPRWDPNAAARLVRMGAGEGTIVFSAGRRRIFVSVKDLDESVCASAIQRLSMPAKSETVLFTAGHGEPAIDDFGPSGLGDAVRALRQDGYRVDTFHSLTSSIPAEAECSVVAVVGARMPFSAAELRELGLFLAQGGRILAAVPIAPGMGITPLLERHGIGVTSATGTTQTTDGSDIVVTEFGDHAVSRPLEGSAVVFAPDAVRFRLPPATEERSDGFSLVSLCGGGDVAFAVAVEKGSALKSDLAIRPARMVVIGDPSFFLNGSLASRANANRDFFLNAVAWLAGLDVSGSVGIAGNVLSARMDRSHRIRFLALSVCGVPLVIAVIGLFAVIRKRRC